MVMIFNSNLNKKDKFICDASPHRVEGSADVVGRGTYGGEPY
jgi:hypothetical protein